MMTVIPYQPEHLAKIEVKKIHQTEVPRTILSEALTFVDGEKPVAIFGSFTVVTGVAHIWALISEDVRKKPVAFHKLVGQLLSIYQKRSKLRRVQIDVRVDYAEGQRWAESLGFQREGIMKSFGTDGSDHYLFSRCP